MTAGPPTVREPTGSQTLVALLVGSSLAAGAVTVLAPHLLTGPPAMNGSAKGTALVVCLVAAPLLAVAGRRARHGSLADLTVAAGAAAFLVYNGVLLVFGTPFNRAFPLYEAMLGLGVWTMARLGVEIWSLSSRPLLPPQRWPAGFILGAVALNLAAWAARLAPALLSEDPRSMLSGTGLTTNPVYVQDLAFWLPAFVWIAAGMWRGDGPRSALGAVALTYWVLESVSVAVDQWWGHRADPSSSVVSVSLVPVFVLVGVLTLWPLTSVLRALAAPRPVGGPATPVLRRTAEAGPPRSASATPLRLPPRVPARYVGWFFLWTSGIHVGIVAADPGLYRHFADGALVPGLTAAWSSTYMAHATVSGLVVALGEATLALLLLLGSRTWRRLGWTGVVAFHLALMCFGWGFWLWCVPAMSLVVPAARRDLAAPDGPGSSQQMTVVDHRR